MSIYRVHAYNPVTAKTSVTQVDVDNADKAIDMVMKTHLPIYKLLKAEFLNEYKNWEPVIQVAITPVDGRMETGPLKINDDWCGYFVRGDNAVGVAIDVEQIEEWYKELPAEYRKNWIIMNNVISFLKDMASCRNK